MRIAQGTTLSGRYDVLAPLGVGGMGEVWRCRDRERGADVAVKIVRADVLDDTTLRLFGEEVMSTARLDHPAIVRVYDLVQDERGLALVLELREGAPLSRAELGGFSDLRRVAEGVLEGLAYAHARGVLHLDIKPANILVDLSREPPRVTLLDFGIARAWRREAPDDDPSDLVLGTFAYMAPEQITSDAAVMGPWTDLYALGATLHQQLTGMRPFGGVPLAERAFRPAQRLDARALGLPLELADLLAAMMAPRPEDRPSHAADVLHALRALAEVDAPLGAAAGVAGPTSADTSVATAVAPRDTEASPRIELPVRPSDPPTVPAARAPDRLEPAREEPTPGAYALFGLRDPTLLGRREERERLWEALVGSRREGAVRVIAIGGASGAGKSRLARDAVERAHQTGLAHTAQTAWSAGGAGNEGLRRLLEHAVGTGGARGIDLEHALRTWARRFGGDDDPRFVREAKLLLEPAGKALEADLPLRVTCEALGRLAASRAVVVWLDDVQHGRDVPRRLVDRLRERGGAVSVVATRGEPDDERLGADLTLRLAPLDADATVKLVRGLLDLGDGLAERLAARGRGNPLVVTQLVAELIGDGALVRREGAHVLVPGYDLDALPGELEALWDRRIARAGLDPASLGAVALTRPRVGVETVARLVGELGPVLAHQVRAAVRANLLYLRRGAYEWVHDRLRAHLVASVPDAARPRLHAAAAAALLPLVGAEDVQAERAEHLWAAERRREACEAMLDAVATSLRAADAEARERRAAALLGWSERAGLAGYRARAHAELAHVSAQRGDRDAARDHLARATSSPGEVSPWVSFRAAQVETLAGRPDAAEAAARRALETARAEGDLEVEAQAEGYLALAAHRRRDIEEARARFERAAELARAAGDAPTEARALMHLANLHPTESLALFEDALDAAIRAGAVRGELAIRQVYADALYLSGDTARAEAEMRTVDAQARALRLRQLVSITQIQLAIWALREGDVARAADHRDRARAAGALEGSRSEVCMFAAVRCAVAAAEGDEPEVDDALRELAAVRGDFDQDELREVLELARSHARGALAERIGAALTPRSG